MAEFHVLNLYHDAFLSDTSHLGALETGAYIALLLASWRTEGGGLPDDDVMLARMARCTTREWKRIRPLVMAYWTMCQDGKWRQKRLEIEREAARAKSKSASRAAKAKWKAENAAMPNGDRKPRVNSPSEVALTAQDREHTAPSKALNNNNLPDADASSAHMRNACESDALTSMSMSTSTEEVETPSSESAREDDIGCDLPPENQDGLARKDAAVLTRAPSDNRSRGARTPGDVLAGFMRQTGPPEKRMKRQDRADQDMVRHLTTKGGMDTARAWTMVMAARDDDDPHHIEAARELEKISARNKLGFFVEEQTA